MDKLLELIESGKSYDDIKKMVLDGEETVKDVKPEDIKAAFDTYEEKQEKVKQFTQFEAKKDLEGAAAELETKVLGKVEDIIVEKMDELPIDKIANAVVAKTVEAKGKEYKSKFMQERESLKVKDSWKSKMREMLLADRSGNYIKSNELSNKFLESSELYGDTYKKSVLTGDSTTGSYAVPDEFSDMVIVTAERNAPIYENATKLTMSSDKLNLLGAGNVTFTEESDQTASAAQSEPTLTQTSLDIIDASAYSELHRDLIADSNVDMIGLLAGSYGRGLATYLKRATAVGNVTTTSDLVDGIYSISGIGSVAVADAGSSMAYDDLVGLVQAVDEVFRDGAYFEMNDREWAKILKIKDNDGRPIFNTGAMMDFNNLNLLGYPVKFNNQIPLTLNPSTGARTGGSETTILFGNPKEVFIGFKGGMEFMSSAHYKFKQRREAFLGVIRWDMDVVNTESWARLTNIK